MLLVKVKKFIIKVWMNFCNIFIKKVTLTIDFYIKKDEETSNFNTIKIRSINWINIKELGWTKNVKLSEICPHIINRQTSPIISKSQSSCKLLFDKQT